MEKKQIVATYLNKEDKKALEQLAKKADRSLSNYVYQLIRDKIKQEKEQQK